MARTVEAPRTFPFCLRTTGIALACGVAAACCDEAIEYLVAGVYRYGSAYPDYIDLDRPECPHSWDSVAVLDTVGRERGVALRHYAHDRRVAGHQTDVPEYNDCQAFPDEDGNYRQLMAIFASSGLGRMSDSAFFRLPDSARSRAVAEIYRFPDTTRVRAESPRYMGIQDHFNCLYILPDGNGLTARMVPVGERSEACLERYDSTSAPGKRLLVRRVALEQFDPGAIPPVARWDWDSLAARPYIGIACGRAWCEVGDSALTSSETYLEGSTDVSGMARVLRIKGWYDQQYLAVPGPGAVRASGLRGTIIPHPALAGRDMADFDSTWIPSVYVALEGDSAAAREYEQKMNLEPAPVSVDPQRMNELSYCFGTREECGTGDANFDDTVCERPFTDKCNIPIQYWWVRVVSANTRDTSYYCVQRRHHERGAVPPTARWRWLATDETSWTACTNGCCEAKQKR